MKYAHIKQDGQLLGWYDKDIHTSIPTPNMEVSDDAWQNAIDNGHNKVNADGTTELYDFRTAEEIAQAETEQAVQEAYAYLASTDWITAKYNDVVTVLGTMSKADFVTKYKEIYDNRTAARAVLGGE
jgi:hypothetical protein